MSVHTPHPKHPKTPEEQAKNRRFVIATILVLLAWAYGHSILHTEPPPSSGSTTTCEDQWNVYVANGSPNGLTHQAYIDNCEYVVRLTHP